MTSIPHLLFLVITELLLFYFIIDITVVTVEALFI